jgi:eukaryotic-like serine/threonine-protein kinase
MSTGPALPLDLPTHLRVTGPLGGGGHGAVWRARDTRRGRDVALKLLDVPLGKDRGADRLEREVRALARLQDVPGVVSILECGVTTGGRAWLVTELVDGPSVAELLREGALGVHRALVLGHETAAALAVAHERGLAHGDLTPSNLVLDRAGRTRIIDLGLADLGDGRPGSGCTPAYSAPERLRGAPATASSDMWSLGAVITTAASGDPPGVSSGPEAHELPAVIADCLSADPRRRPTAADLAGALEHELGPCGGTDDGRPGRAMRGARRRAGRRWRPG